MKTQIIDSSLGFAFHIAPEKKATLDPVLDRAPPTIEDAMRAEGPETSGETGLARTTRGRTATVTSIGERLLQSWEGSRKRVITGFGEVLIGCNDFQDAQDVRKQPVRSTVLCDPL